MLLVSPNPLIVLPIALALGCAVERLQISVENASALPIVEITFRDVTSGRVLTAEAVSISAGETAAVEFPSGTEWATMVARFADDETSTQEVYCCIVGTRQTPYKVPPGPGSEGS